MKRRGRPLAPLPYEAIVRESRVPPCKLGAARTLIPDGHQAASAGAHDDAPWKHTSTS